jgi:hypothetical protein
MMRGSATLLETDKFFGSFFIPSFLFGGFILPAFWAMLRFQIR